MVYHSLGSLVWKVICSCSIEFPFKTRVYTYDLSIFTHCKSGYLYGSSRDVFNTAGPFVSRLLESFRPLGFHPPMYCIRVYSRGILTLSTPFVF